LFITRKHDENKYPELILAWDEEFINENPEIYDKAYHEALTSIGEDLEEFRMVYLNLNAEDIKEAFDPVTINFRED
jgi:hypothetical protein